MPEAFLISDELLRTASRLVNGLVIDETAMQRNLAFYGPFAAIERVLMALVKAGADRQAMHERLRQHSLAVWPSVQAGASNPLIDLLSSDEILLTYLPADEIRRLMDAEAHLGNAPQRALSLAKQIRLALE